MNGVITGYVGIHVIWIERIFDDPRVNVFEAWSPSLDFLFAVFLGYTIYDMLTMAFQSHHWSMWIHHLLGLLGCIVVPIYKQALIYPCYFMVTEWTVIFNNLVWFVKTIRDSDAKSPSLLYVYLLHARAWSFFALRIWVGPYSVYHSIVAAGGLQTVIQFWASLHWTASFYGIATTAMFSFFNVVWTVAIFQKAFAASAKLKRAKQE